MDEITDLDIVFNDAGGSDSDLEGMYYTLYQAPCNAWNGLEFYVHSSEFAHSILLDDPKEDIRYCAIFNYRDYTDLRFITLYVGKSWKGEVGQEYRPTQTLEINNSIYSYRDFLSYDGEKISALSKDKFIRTINSFMKLKAFL
jgi:hypothetical protein